jgi:thiol-disulfide isomerase/thioredoxin
MPAIRIYIVATMAVVTMAACKKRDPDPIPPTPNAAMAEATPDAGSGHHPGEGIDWFAGDVDAAFARAKAEGKPVFLYWGAEWCPPCHELKASVFSRADFQQKAKLFIPVYLDGDTTGAQKWGDVFKVSGYPTVVILDGDRRELTRMSGGMDLSQYAESLDLVLGDVRPVNDTLASLEKDPKPLSADDCRRLAYNDWVLAAQERKAEEIAAALQVAAQMCPAELRVERARLVATAASSSASADSKSIEAGKPASARTLKLAKEVYDILGEREVALAATDALRNLDDDFFHAVKRNDPKHAGAFLERWSGVMDAAAADERFAETDRIYALVNKLQAVKALSADGKIPAPLAAEVTGRVDAALAKKHQGYERAGVVNASLWALDTLDEQDRIRAVLEHEVKTAKQPYYYMLDLASVEEKAGHKDKAVEWLERAYRESQGVATRFQWGTEYVLGLVRMQPENGARIRDASFKVLGELDGPDRIYMRTASRLKRLDSTLREWNKDGAHAREIAVLRDHMSGICGKIPAEEPARKTCDSFLAAKA